MKEEYIEPTYEIVTLTSILNTQEIDPEVPPISGESPDDDMV